MTAAVWNCDPTIFVESRAGFMDSRAGTTSRLWKTGNAGFRELSARPNPSVEPWTLL
jgi:hypothetical protein